jgi:uncharacterized protein (UPF0261 family)
MKLEELYKLAKVITQTIGDSVTTDVTIYLNESKHQNLQQEVFKIQNNTLQGYKSKDKFDVIIYNVKFLLKIR